MAHRWPLRAFVAVLFSLAILCAFLQGMDRIFFHPDETLGVQEICLHGALPPAVLTSSPSAVPMDAHSTPAMQGTSRQEMCPALALASLGAALWARRARGGRDRNGNVLQRRSYMLSMHQAFSFSDGSA